MRRRSSSAGSTGSTGSTSAASATSSVEAPSSLPLPPSVSASASAPSPRATPVDVDAAPRPRLHPRSSWTTLAGAALLLTAATLLALAGARSSSPFEHRPEASHRRALQSSSDSVSGDSTTTAPAASPEYEAGVDRPVQLKEYETAPSATQGPTTFAPTTPLPKVTSSPAPVGKITATSNPTNAGATLTTTSMCPSLGEPQSGGGFKCYADRCAWDIGNNLAACAKSKGCTPSTSQYPWCFSTARLNRNPLPAAENNCPSRVRGGGIKNSFVKNFFVRKFGVHMAEGTRKLVMYNVDVDFCALACINAANRTGQELPDGASPDGPIERCLSFDFYAFEAAIGREVCGRGTCVLNSDNAQTARLRNEFQSFTEAELFLESATFYRPTSYDTAYYEVLDSRAGAISELLDPTLGRFQDDFVADVVVRPPFLIANNMPGSKWGAQFIDWSPLDDRPMATQCSIPGAKPDWFTRAVPDSKFIVAFAPMTDEGNCPGQLGYKQQEQLCALRGGRLCTASEFARIDQVKVGCNFFSSWQQNRDTWTQGSKDTKKGPFFPRCCSEFWMEPARDTEFCAVYQPQNIRYCAALRSQSDCTKYGSGTWMQLRYGYGAALNIFRDRCRQDPSQCSGPVKVTPFDRWRPHDKCVWCPNPSVTNPGTCMPGGHYGICSQAAPEAKRLFSQVFKGKCGGTAVCQALATFGSMSPTLRASFLQVIDINSLHPPDDYQRPTVMELIKDGKPILPEIETASVTRAPNTGGGNPPTRKKVTKSPTTPRPTLPPSWPSSAHVKYCSKLKRAQCITALTVNNGATWVCKYIPATRSCQACAYEGYNVPGCKDTDAPTRRPTKKAG